MQAIYPGHNIPRHPSENYLITNTIVFLQSMTSATTEDAAPEVPICRADALTFNRTIVSPVSESSVELLGTLFDLFNAFFVKSEETRYKLRIKNDGTSSIMSSNTITPIALYCMNRVTMRLIACAKSEKAQTAVTAIS